MDWITLFVSVILALATTVLAIYTWLLWRETLAARQPLIAGTLDILGPRYAELRLVNAGRGAAIEIDVAFSPEPNGQERRWIEPVLLSGEGSSFNLVSHAEAEATPGLADLNELVEVFPTMSVQGVYYDVRGKEYAINQTLNINTKWKEVLGANQLAAYRGPLRPIHEALDAIRRSIDKLPR